MIPRKLRHIECCFDRLVQLLDLGGVACTHQPLQSLTRNSEDVVQVRHTATRQSLLTTEHHFGRKLTDGSCDERNDDRTDGGENGVAGEDNHRSVANWRRQLEPTRFLRASRVVSFPVGSRREFVEQCNLRFGYLGCVQVRNCGGVEILADSLLHDGAHIPALLRRKTSQLLFHVAG